MWDGYLARWRGSDFEASPDGAYARLYGTGPLDGFTEVSPGRYRAVVELADLDGFWYVRTHCVWHGEPFLVLGEDGGWLRVEYAGATEGLPARLRLEEVDAGIHQGWAPRHEVSAVELRRV
jgi:hypothetical protein